MPRTGSCTASVPAPPDQVFARIVDLSGLPGWNDRMTGVSEVPERLEPGAEWVVGMKLLGKRFSSRSTVVEIDRSRRRFVHRSKPDDDNPSHAVWTWQVDPDGDCSRVTLSWELRPLTPVRRLVFAPLRGWQIPRSDAPASLAALARACQGVTA